MTTCKLCKAEIMEHGHDLRIEANSNLLSEWEDGDGNTECPARAGSPHVPDPATRVYNVTATVVALVRAATEGAAIKKLSGIIDAAGMSVYDDVDTAPKAFESEALDDDTFVL